MILGMGRKIGTFVNNVCKVKKTDRLISPWVSELRRQQASGEVDVAAMFAKAQEILMPKPKRKQIPKEELADVLQAMAKHWRLLRPELREVAFQIENDHAFLFGIGFSGKCGGRVTIWDAVVFWATRQMGTWQGGEEIVADAVKVLYVLAKANEDVDSGKPFAQEYASFLLEHRSLVLGLGVTALKAIWLFAKENDDGRLLTLSLVCLWREVGSESPPPGLIFGHTECEGLAYMHEIVPVFVGETAIDRFVRLMEETSQGPIVLEGLPGVGQQAEDTAKTLKFLVSLTRYCISEVCEEQADKLRQELGYLISMRSKATGSPFNEAEAWCVLAMAAIQAADFPQGLRYDMLLDLLQKAGQTERAGGIEVPIGKEGLEHAWSSITAMSRDILKDGSLVAYDGPF